MTAEAGKVDPHLWMRRRLVLADDDPKILDMVGSLLGSHYDIVGRASDGQTLVDTVLRLSPDVAVVDISMPRLSGIEATRTIRASGGIVKIVILSVYDDSAYVEAAFDAGAHGYVLKLAAENELIPAIEAVATNGSYLSIGLR